MTTLVALCTISRRHPDFKGLATTGYDSDGEPILRVHEERVAPGVIFDEQDDATVETLLEMEAARLATEAEQTVFEEKAA